MKNTSIFSRNNITSLAIGRFDGIHLGHQKLFDNLDKNGGVFVVNTGKANLTPPEFLSRFLNLPYFIYDLNEIKDLNPDKFIQRLMCDFPKLHTIVVGDDFRFGRNRCAGTDELRNIFSNVIIVDELKINSVGVHSRYIRSLLLSGNVTDVKKYLGRFYSLCGKVVTGQGIGSVELYATVNMTSDNFFLPSEGVYITKLLSKSERYDAVSFLGHRVSTDGNYSIESHILSPDFVIDSNICLEFHQKIRDNMYFEDIAKLKKQITIDIEYSKKYFENN